MNISTKLNGLFAAVVAAVGITAVAAEPSVTINEVKSVKPWNGVITVDYSLANIKAGGWYEVSFDITANGVTRKAVTTSLAKLTEGKQPVKTIETTAIFGREAVDKAAKVKVTLTEVPESKLGGVQLWEGGPIWAESNLGETGDFFWDEYEYGSLYGLADAPTAMEEPWRLPTEDEFNSLLNWDICDWEWDYLGGWTVRGKGDFAENSIYLPAAGYGDTYSPGARWCYCDEGDYWSFSEGYSVMGCLNRYHLAVDDFWASSIWPDGDESAMCCSIRAVRDADPSGEEGGVSEDTVVATEEEEFWLGPEEMTVVRQSLVGSGSLRELIGVPFLGFDGEAIALQDYVVTDNMTAGDMLFIYNKAVKTYDSYVLDAEKKWTAAKTITSKGDKVEEKTAPDPESVRIPLDTAVWIERADASRSITFKGRAFEGAVNTVFPGDWNLVSFPGTVAKTVGKLGFERDTDIIIVPTAAAPIRYTKRNGQWGFYKETFDGLHTSVEWTTAGATIAPGQGFWLVRETDKCVQLWENGPFWAELNLGGSEVEGHQEYGALYSYEDSLNAVKKLGDGWRVPTNGEFMKLGDSNVCGRKWDDFRKGWVFTGKGAFAQNSIFLPAAGEKDGNGRVGCGNSCSYGTSTHEGEGGGPAPIWVFHANADGSIFGIYAGSHVLSYGYSVRPVRDTAL